MNGVTTVVRRIVDLLGAEGHASALVAPAYPGGDPPPRTAELRLRSVGFPPYPDIRISLPRAARVTQFLDAFGPDVVHVSTEGPIGVMGRRWAVLRNVPLVTSYHTQFPQYTRHYGAAPLEPLVWRWVEWFHRPARLTHTPGEAMRRELEDHGIPQAAVWGRGVDSAHFHPGRRDRAWRRRFGVGDDVVLVLHVGRLAPEKNLDTLAVAWRIAESALGRRAVFVIAGDGPRSRPLFDAVPFARRLGFLDRHTLASLYASADLCVLPSDTETCGLVALEAMASGLPVVAADAGGLRESVVDGRNGLLAPPKDSAAFAARIVELALNTVRRREMGALARLSAQTRDIAVENAELLRQYAGLAGKTPEATPCAA